MKDTIQATMLTERSKKVFLELVSTAANWNGVPLWNEDGSSTRADNASLTDLKKKGLVVTTEDEARDLATGRKHINQFVSFTKEGLQLAKELNANSDGIEEIESNLKGE